MKLHSSMEVQGALLLVVVNGELSFNAAWDVLKQTYDTALEKHMNLILVDSLAVEGKLTTFEKYRLGTETVTYFRSRLMHHELRLSENHRLWTDSPCLLLRIAG